MYQKRDRDLKRLGFECYTDYLRSPLWDVIRREVIKRDFAECAVVDCLSERGVRQVHHLSYTLSVLLGLKTSQLVTVCQFCHERLEFSKHGYRLSPRSKQRRNLRLLKSKREGVEYFVSRSILRRVIPSTTEYDILLVQGRE